MYVCFRLCEHIYIYINVCTCVCIYMCLSHTYVRMYLYIHMYICAFVYANSLLMHHGTHMNDTLEWSMSPLALKWMSHVTFIRSLAHCTESPFTHDFTHEWVMSTHFTSRTQMNESCPFHPLLSAHHEIPLHTQLHTWMSHVPSWHLSYTHECVVSHQSAF